MTIHFLDPYQPLVSPVHTMDSRAKFILTIAFILTASLTPIAAWPVYILLFAIILSVEILSGLGVVFVLKRSLLVIPFILAALPVIFTLDGQALFSFPLFSWTLTASVEGLERFFSIALKSWLSVQAAIVLSACTPFPELLQAMRAVGIPRMLVGMFGLMWRYLFVLVDEAMRMMRARSARSGVSEGQGKKQGGKLAWRAHVMGGMAGSLFLRGFERSERIYVAMLSRGYDGEVRTMQLPPFSRSSWVVLITCLVFLIFLLLFGLLFWG